MNTKIQTTINEILMDKLALDEAPKLTDSLVNDLGADSLDAVEVIMDCETEFNIKIPDEEAEKIATVGDMVNVVADKVGETA
jgi:acyl carrier protein